MLEKFLLKDFILLFHFQDIIGVVSTHQILDHLEPKVIVAGLVIRYQIIISFRYPSIDVDKRPVFVGFKFKQSFFLIFLQVPHKNVIIKGVLLNIEELNHSIRLSWKYLRDKSMIQVKVNFNEIF